MSSSVSLFSKLEKFYLECKKFFLDIQNPVTGLLPSSLFSGTSRPASSANFAWVRDNVYSALCMWSLSISYRKINDLYDVSNRCLELDQSEKVEKFKKTLDKSYSLHSKYLIGNFGKITENCGLAVGDTEWGHLQIDATSLYLLILAQMISSGLNIIFSLDEVCFIQNLVYYIENAYCTPDYGIFERGDKTNHGLPELNASSIGMAKAMSNFNLFGAIGGQSSIIYVQPDNIYKCNALLESILPKESLSKEVGASLLSITGFPAFAVDNPEILNHTKQSILTKLEGRYGLRRFLRDGYKTAVEDPNRLHYEVYELKIFENIECEWPLFFTYLIIDGVVNNDFDMATRYYNKLKNVAILSQDGYEMIPELYYVPLENVQAEYKVPKSQNRKHSLRLPHLWSQSLYMVARLFYEKILSPADIDPLNRRIMPETRSELVVQVLLVSQDEESYSLLEENNIKSYRLQGDTAISILPACFLNDVYENVGVCEKLKLSGRPKRDIGIVSTSILYRTKDKFYAFNPQFMDTSHFYFTFDQKLIEDFFKNEMNYIRTNWTFVGQPTLVLSVSSVHLENSMTSILGEFITKLTTGHYWGIRVQIGTLSDFISTSCIAEWDNFNETVLNDLLGNMCIVVQKKKRRLSSVFERSESKLDTKTNEEAGHSSRLDEHLRQTRHMSPLAGPSMSFEEPDSSPRLFSNPSDSVPTLNSSEKINNLKTTSQLLEVLETADDIYEQALCLFEICKLEGPNYQIILKNGINYGSLNSLFRELYNIAGSHKLWLLLRYTSGFLRKEADGLAHAAVSFFVRQKQFSVGYPSYREDLVPPSTPNNRLKDLIYDAYQEDLIGAVLTQEVLIYLSMFIRTEKHIFDAMIRLRLGLIIEVAASEFAKCTKISPDQLSDVFLNLSPYFMKNLVYHIMSGKELVMVKRGNEYVILGSRSRLSKIVSSESSLNSSQDDEEEADQVSEQDTIGCWYRRRFLDGSLNRIPDTFYSGVWLILDSCKGLSLDGYFLENTIICEMTPNEMKFALRVESALNSIVDPEYRQIMIELMMLFGKLLTLHKITHMKNSVVQLELIIAQANEYFLEGQTSVQGDASICCAGRIKTERKCTDSHNICQFFYDSAPSGEYGTMNFLTRSLLHFIYSSNPQQKGLHCHVT